MAGKNQVTITFAGDAAQLDKAAEKAAKSVGGVGDAAAKAGKQTESAGKSTGDYEGHVAKLSIITAAASDNINQVGDTINGLIGIQREAKERASAHARALLEVQQAGLDAKQAIRDLNQATLDIGQAQIDQEQAALDAQVAQGAYNDAVKKYGPNSAEAKQAAIDMKQAQQDLKQAGEDVAQAQQDQQQAVQDGAQAVQDQKDAVKDARDTTNGWQTDLNTALSITAAVPGVIGLATAAQWAWNIAMDANPIGLIVLAIGILIAVIVLIATKTDWFQKAWKAAWGWIKDAASAVADWFKGPFVDFFVGAWNKIKGWIDTAIGWFKGIPGMIGQAFSGLVNILTAPYRTAFNFIADAWNNTIGRLSWSVPGWVPVIGGKTISVPQLPHFHTGGVVPGAPGSETLAVLQAGERVIPAGSGGTGGQLTVRFAGNTDSAFATAFMNLVRTGLIQVEAS